jgi:general secretion pathway protein A
MYEQYYRLNETPFGLMPDPRYRYPSESLVKAIELLQTSIARDECFAVVTGDTGTGKTTLCRALVEQGGKTTVIAL